MPRYAARLTAPQPDSDASGQPLGIPPAPELAPVLPLHIPTRPKRTPDAKRRQDPDRKARSSLWYGDNLTWLRDRDAFPSESVDLVYLDPPFNSDRVYNVIFHSPGGAEAAAQIQAFDDTWTWSDETSAALREFCRTGPPTVAALISALHAALGETNMTAYLVMMGLRLVELHRVMKRTASLYLHCDPTASHYLKITLDAVFGPRNFRNEIIWKRTSSHNDAKRFADVHDTILYYAKSPDAVWNPQSLPHNEKYVQSHYARTDAAGRRYRLDNIIRSASMGSRPNLAYEYKGYAPQWGWRVKRDKLEALDAAGRLTWSRSGTPYFVRYLDEMSGAAMPTVWDDIPPVNSQAKERLGFPTQKPLALLERIISSSSDRDAVILDPFCGCGTAIVAAEKLGRRWIGIDITSFAIDVIEQRLDRDFEAADFRVNGLPETVEDAEALFRRSPYQFQWWAAGRIKAQPRDGRKKGADEGVDGILPFFDDASNRPKTCVVSVKGGRNIGPEAVRDLAGAVAARKAHIGVLITLIDPTPKMKQAARDAQVYFSALGRDYPKIQIVTVADILANRMPAIPGEDWQRRPGRRIPAAAATQQPLLGAD
jgi:site-specific DNA-methyltransferase (adenine-specific)